MSKCFYTDCSKEAEWMAETEVAHVPFCAEVAHVPFCAEHYNTMIESAIKNNPGWAPDVVRSCMERASYRIDAARRVKGEG